MNDCLFCKIIAGEIPSTKIFEDEQVYVFADIAPTAPIHWLVIPKTHIAKLSDITPENSAVIAHIYGARGVQGRLPRSYELRRKSGTERVPHPLPCAGRTRPCVARRLTADSGR